MGSATPVYVAGYDPWGNENYRSYNGVTASLFYNVFNELTEYNAGSQGQEFYAYDASGNRVLRKSTSGVGLTVYAFGSEEYFYGPTGTFSSCTHYYQLAGHLVAELNGSTLQFELTDAQGSVLMSLSSSAVLGEQVYGPYGNQRYTTGTMGTDLGYTGQVNDALTGLDYYNARYYDPVVGVFMSADDVQGNAEGMDPYTYVDGNPETLTDPTGARPVGSSGSSPAPSCLADYDACAEAEQIAAAAWAGAAAATAITAGTIIAATIAGAVIVASVGLMFVPYQDTPPNYGNGPQPSPLPSVPTSSPSVSNQNDGGGDFPNNFVNSHILNRYRPAPGLQTQPAGGSGGGGFNRPPAPAAGGECSFTPDTQVTTDQGKEAIGDLQVGEKVMAYNPKTHKMEAEPILHVWKHSDNDLIDLTLTSEMPAHDGKPASKTSEVVHTTSEHPFLTTEQGFTPAGQLKVGMHVLRADGSVGVVTNWRVVPGTKEMYNLEVQQDHTFTVGAGEWVVHNQCGPQDRKLLRQNMENNGVEFQQGQAAHHVIPCMFKNHSLLQQGNFDVNEAYNGRALWGKGYEGNALDVNEPWHAAHYYYNKYAESLLDQASANLGPGDAFTAAMGVVNQLNSWINLLGFIGVAAGAACKLTGPTGL